MIIFIKMIVVLCIMVSAHYAFQGDMGNAIYTAVLAAINLMIINILSKE